MSVFYAGYVIVTHGSVLKGRCKEGGLIDQMQGLGFFPTVQ